MAVALFVISVGAGFGLTTLLRNEVPFYAGLLIGVYLLLSIKVADQWEKVAVLRLGRFIGLRGPGLFHVIPIVDPMCPRNRPCFFSTRGARPGCPKPPT